MTILDRLLQRWRIAKVTPFIEPGQKVLDVGCSNAALFDSVSALKLIDGIEGSPSAPRV